jgi:uncharacterized membrane protein YqiK
MDYALAHWQVIAATLAVLLLVFGYRWVLWLCGVIIVPDDSIGVVTKKFVLFGRNRDLPDGRIIALNGEAGYQADTLPPGLQFGYWPWQYTVELVEFFSIPPGKLGAVEARDGRPLASGKIVAQQVSCNSFQDARAFLENAGAGGGTLVDVLLANVIRDGMSRPQAKS